MSKRTKWLLAIVAIAALVVGWQVAAFANHTVSLAGSNFEIEDSDPATLPGANLTVEHPSPPSLDWANVDQDQADDAIRSQQDDSFGQGTKEDTAIPQVIDGSIPNNKSDLLNFGTYTEKNAAGTFLNLYWIRVQEPTGTTNMDFELNQSTVVSGNGVTPVRTAGDVLVQYDLSQGGTRPTISVSRWVTTGSASQCEASNQLPCWGTKTTLNDTLATGSINNVPIDGADSDGIIPDDQQLSARTFGEASINLNALTGGSTDCVAFASAYLKSRASDSFTAALKDFIAPVPTSISNCGSIKVIKDDAENNATKLAGAEFSLYKDNSPIGGSPGTEDIGTQTTPIAPVDTCTTDANGECLFDGVFRGDYWVIETKAPPEYDLPNPPYQAVTVTADEQVTVTFHDPPQKGAIKVTKTRKHAADGPGDHPQSGVDFTVDGVTKSTGADGTACFDGLGFGSYTVHETVPAGYHVDANDKQLTVDNKASCADSTYVGESVSFHNTPLTNISASVDSQVDGGTASTITCTNSNGDTVGSGTTDATGDGSASASDLEPGTYTCTLVIDP